MILKWSKFNEADTTYRYYQNISYLEYYNLRENAIQFNNDDYSILSNIHEYEFSKPRPIFLPPELRFRSRFIYGQKAILGRIYKVEDEWYLVELDKNITKANDPVFKCDQIDGLVRFLRKIWGNPSFEVNESTLDHLTDLYSSTRDIKTKVLNFRPEEKKKLLIDIANIFNMYTESLCIECPELLIQVKKKYFEGLKISISKHKDEWYTLHIDNYNTFSCDQYDGLIQCLKDIKDDFDNVIKIHNL